MGTKSKKTKGLKLVKAAPTLLKLDLACGLSPADGFEGVDIAGDKAKHKFDLLKFPWPFADNSVGEIHCSHFIEHIPMEVLPSGQDLFFAFFDEVYRVIHKEGTAKFIWPALRSNRAFQDPTHRRFIPQESLAYLNRKWRELNNLTHYNVKCDFVGDCVHSCASELMALSPEVQARRFNESWNTVIDFIATLKPVK